MTNALRPSELFALRWKCFNLAESTMSVSETAYMDKIRPWGKTRKSLGVIHIPRKLTADLWRWKQQCPDPTPQAFIFANKDGDFMDTGNYRKRVLHKLAAELELPKLTFRSYGAQLRRWPKRRARLRTCKACSGILARQPRRMCICRRFRRACRRRSIPSIRS